MTNTLFGFPVQENNTLPSVEGVTVLPFSFPVQAVYAHPSMFSAGIGDTYQGVRVVRDKSIPWGELHIHTGTHIVKMTRGS